MLPSFAMTDVLSRQSIALNMPAATEADQKARQMWETNRTVEITYVRQVLGDPAMTVAPGLLPVRILTKAEIRRIECPYPPEPGYE